MVDGQLRDSKVLCSNWKETQTESLREQEEEKGNMIICSSDVALFLQMAIVLDYARS